MRPQGSAEELERRRRRAVELFESGEDKDDISRILDVTRRSIDRWIEAKNEGGDEALCAKPHPGARPRLSKDQQREVIGWIGRSPTEFGYSSELWTAGRVAKLIEKRLHVHYHPCYVSRWLFKHGITPQKPRRVPLERDDQAIDWWLEHIWRAVKRARREHAWIVIIDESGTMLAPLVKRTLAPQGHTPVIRQRAKHRQKVSMIAALTCSPVKKKLRLFFALHKNLSFNSQRVRWFLGKLLKHIKGKLFVIWDNGMMHKGPVIRKLLTKTRRIELFALPPYAPDCDPVEPLWSNLKYHRMANYIPDSVHSLYRTAKTHLARLAQDQHALASCFNASRLKLPGRRRKTLTG